MSLFPAIEIPLDGVARRTAPNDVRKFMTESPLMIDPVIVQGLQYQTIRLHRSLCELANSRRTQQDL